MNHVDHHAVSIRSLGRLIGLIILFGISLLALEATAQTSYSCFPSCNEKDGRFLAIAGTGISTFAGDTVQLAIGSPSTADSLKIGIFDGETGGYWDIGTTSVTFTLLADPTGTGTGTYQVAEWSGNSMTDNAWQNLTVKNHENARAPNGNYLYTLRAASSNPATTSSTAFKVRVLGTLAVRAHQSFDFIAAMPNTSSAQTLYPNYPNLDTTTYDGMWTIYLDVPAAASSLTVWDGDMDYGNYDGSAMDTNDVDTPDEIVSWGEGTEAIAEGIAGGNPKTDATGATIGGTSTGAPCDNERRLLFRRDPSVTYKIVDPLGNEYLNSNPSGNREWEQFKISTAPFDRSAMDYHADSLPAGMYKIVISGMDLGNLNAWRFFNDAIGGREVLGKDASGGPVAPLRPYHVKGKVFYDADSNGTQGLGEPGIPSVAVELYADRNNDGVIDKKFYDTTNSSGEYTFNNLYAGTYKVAMDMNTLAEDVRPTGDADGASTQNVATVTVGGSSSSTTTSTAMSFSYKRLNPPGTGTRGYWVNHPENWPVSSLTLGGVSYTKEEALNILRKATKGDKTYSMAAQLIAAKLNVANGNQSSCIGDTIVDADEWLETYPIGTKPNNAAWNVGSPLHNKLDSYNNGNECAPHMG